MQNPLKMKFYSADLIDSQSIDKSSLFPIYIRKETTTTRGTMNTIIRLTKQPTNTIYAYCSVAEFQIGDMFKYNLQNEEKENQDNMSQKRNGTTIKRTKQANLFSFMKNKK